MKIERIKQEDGRVRFGDLTGGDAFLDDRYDGPQIKCNVVIVDLHKYRAFCPDCGGFNEHPNPDELVTPLPDAVIRY